ncbi:MAG: class I SAM-dependent methyltransferase [Planctomycetota bacterium]|nr:class I SAM-dependent methyltransferase [Planctomycetota bacterium]
MSDEDRKKWDAKYAQQDAVSSLTAQPSLLLDQLDHILPRSGKALDVAGGAGRHAIWLAGRGLDVTLADISQAGLDIARARAAAEGVNIETLQIDLEFSPFPAGPWDLIVAIHYLYRPLFEIFPAALAPGGLLVCSQPTLSNLQRHPKPPARFLLQDGELPHLVRDLEVVHYQEGWLAEGRHEALLAARRSPESPTAKR